MKETLSSVTSVKEKYRAIVARYVPFCEVDITYT